VSAVIIQRARNGFIVRPFQAAMPLSGNPEDIAVFPDGSESAIASHLNSLLAAIPSVLQELDEVRKVMADAATAP
jgi:hypothetical protein